MAATATGFPFFPYFPFFPHPLHLQGDIRDLIKQGEVPGKASSAFKAAAGNYMSYIMAIQYGASFGVELVLFNMAASYFHDEFGADVTQAGQIALLCGVRTHPPSLPLPPFLPYQ